MKISRITLTPIQTHRRTGSISSHLILQMHTDEGLTGLGEISDLDCYRMYMPDIDAVRTGIERVVLGRDPFAIEAMHAELSKYLHNYFASAPSYPPFTPGSQIAAGIDMACFDIMGKAVGRPAYDFLGGKTRDHIEVCYPLFQVKAEGDYDRNLGYIDDLLAQGISRFRYYVGVDFAKDEKFLAALRDRFGDRVALKALDFQARHYWKDTLRAYDRLKQFGFEVIESPSWREDFEGMAQIRRRIEADVSEHASSAAQAMAMIRAGAVDIFNVTVNSGGLVPVRKLVALAELSGIKTLIGTTQELSIGTAAHAHLGASMAELGAASDPVGPLLYAEDVVKERIRFDGNRIVVPDGPGLGMELDEDALESLRAPLVEWDRAAHGAGYVSD
ncbi:mandelate racemase/muconate lactonizing enzyme family protein [Paracoccus aurantiacus]|uniref:mandelate racemase/muconate lactonizing enzyme family protein n=1 Tax=Paracoccus aurantiacus TaxID=2599412 RepID=UPI00363A8DB2